MQITSRHNAPKSEPINGSDRDQITPYNRTSGHRRTTNYILLRGTRRGTPKFIR